MRYVFLCCLALVLFHGCKKEKAPRVDIYVLKSFTQHINQATSPATLNISNAVLEDAPLVADQDIAFYIQSEATFKLKKNIKSLIQNYGADKAFAVTVDNQPVYYGKFHPGYLSSLVFGLAIIDPLLLRNNELAIGFVTTAGPNALDKRNDVRLLGALQASGRLR